MRRGCVILIVVICLVLQVISVAFFIFVWPEKKKSGTSQTIYVIEKAMEDYRRDHDGSYPEGDNKEISGVLAGNNAREKVYLSTKGAVMRDGALCDFYKEPLRFEYPEGGSVKISSSGPDKAFETEDDITSALIREIAQDLPPAGD